MCCSAALSNTSAGWGVIVVAGVLNTFVMASPASDSIFRIINAGNNTGNIDEGARTVLEGDVQFRKVHFAYPTRPQHSVLSGLNLTAYAVSSTDSLVLMRGPLEEQCLSKKSLKYWGSGVREAWGIEYETCAEQG
ncbi:unnamed protein product [Gongylonema pulchrum]|uniref:Transmembrane protein n=1 Tax=Gongylonema pulchrum TaxID=637853 RepID=A0A183DDA7_9BILA|nr:unnamed protein product [Gongylonema pulchrum]